MTVVDKAADGVELVWGGGRGKERERENVFLFFPAKEIVFAGNLQYIIIDV